MIQVTFAPEDIERIRHMYKVFPKEVYNAFGQVASIVLRRMRKRMRDVVATWPKSWITEKLHPGRRLGGVLSNPYALQMFRQDRAVLTVGFLSRLDPWARMFQTPELRDFSKGERRNMYLKRVDFKKWGNRYVRPPRDVVETEARASQTEYARWMYGAIRKAIMRSRVMRAA